MIHTLPQTGWGAGWSSGASLTFAKDFSTYFLSKKSAMAK